MGFYEETVADLLAILAEFGQAVTLTKKIAGAYDTSTGKSGPPTTQTLHGVGAAFGYKRDDIDGTKVLKGDARLLLGPKDTTTGATITEPGPDQRLTTADGKDWSIVDVETVAPAGIVVLFKLQLRR